MASLRETRDHIASVRSTLKITSAMKLVSSVKLRKAQQAAESIRPYTEALAAMLSRVTGPDALQEPEPVREGEKVAVVAIAGNSSLCGAFNANVVQKAFGVAEEIRGAGGTAELVPVGRKAAEAFRKAGYERTEDRSELVGHNTYEKSSAFARELHDAFKSGKYDRILLVYNHFVSASSQKVTVEQFLPFVYPAGDGAGGVPCAVIVSRDCNGRGPSQMGGVRLAGQTEQGTTACAVPGDYILEPSREEILEGLLPQVTCLRIHSVLLDSLAAEHAARMIAMQAASDNAEDLLAALTLEYNKDRQHKITSEILDIASGAADF